MVANQCHSFSSKVTGKGLRRYEFFKILRKHAIRRYFNGASSHHVNQKRGAPVRCLLCLQLSGSKTRDDSWLGFRSHGGHPWKWYLLTGLALALHSTTAPNHYQVELSSFETFLLDHVFKKSEKTKAPYTAVVVCFVCLSNSRLPSRLWGRYTAPRTVWYICARDVV